MRLDVYLAEKGIYASRTRAERAVKEGCVCVNGKVETKPSFEIREEDILECLPDPLSYVSRGALKLDFALRHFGIDVAGKKAIDVGSSTGGFTEVLLERGAMHVTAVDVGKDQLDPKLASNANVTSLEKTDVRTLDPANIGKFAVLTCDCSFISLREILPACAALIEPGGIGVFLIKPQFEAGRKAVGKGVVKDKKIREKCVADVTAFAESLGLSKLGEPVESPVTGGDGNVEYLAAFVNRSY